MKAIVFDKDGVLLDMEATWHKAAWVLCRSLAKFSPDSHKAEFFANLFGITSSGFDAEYSLFVSGSQSQMHALVQEYIPAVSDIRVRSAIEQEMFQACCPTPLGDVKGAILALSKAGYRLGVLTNDRAEFTHYCLRKIGIESLISVVIAADSGYGAKPDPKGLLAACEQLEVPPSETVMVGDSQADFEAANRAGVAEFIGVSAEYPNATPALMGAKKLVPDITELLAII